MAVRAALLLVLLAQNGLAEGSILDSLIKIPRNFARAFSDALDNLAGRAGDKDLEGRIRSLLLDLTKDRSPEAGGPSQLFFLGLNPWEDRNVTSLLPKGFEALARRILSPSQLEYNPLDFLPNSAFKFSIKVDDLVPSLEIGESAGLNTDLRSDERAQRNKKSTGMGFLGNLLPILRSQQFMKHPNRINNDMKESDKEPVFSGSDFINILNLLAKKLNPLPNEQKNNEPSPEVHQHPAPPPGSHQDDAPEAYDNSPASPSLDLRTLLSLFPQILDEPRDNSGKSEENVEYPSSDFRENLKALKPIVKYLGDLARRNMENLLDEDYSEEYDSEEYDSAEDKWVSLITMQLVPKEIVQTSDNAVGGNSSGTTSSNNGKLAPEASSRLPREERPDTAGVEGAVDSAQPNRTIDLPDNLKECPECQTVLQRLLQTVAARPSPQ